MLRQEIDEAKLAVSTDTVSISLGEVATMYEEGELNIIPDFQRLFRWSIEKQSNFIESIMVGIPIPPAFVFEKEDGTWELIDGLQRTSTILNFMGVLKDIEGNVAPPSTLVSTKYLPSLNGAVWANPGDNEHAVEKALQLFFRRHRIDFQILKHPSDPRTKYDLFQRLNRGGAVANEQEVRTCSMVLANPDAVATLREFCETDAFKGLFRITNAQHENQKDLDYATRMLCLTGRDLPTGSDVQEFLDKAIVDIFANDNEAWDLLDRVTFAITNIYAALGEDALIPPEERIEGIAPRFSLRALEGIMVGVARNMEAIEALGPEHGEEIKSFLVKRVEEFWKQQEVAEMSAAGLRGTTRIGKTVPFGEQWFNPNG